MTKSSILLIKNGFIKKNFKDIYKGKSSAEIEKTANSEHADEEVWEEGKDNYVRTGFPLPTKRYKIEWQTFNMSIEEPYYWTLNYLRSDLGFVDIQKTIDTFSAAENSAFFGVSQMRIGGQQEKVSQFLATIGKMTKELFQLVRELRIIDERLDYYGQSFKGIESAEITLKGIWIDMVQGGAKNPASVFGMAREVGFTSLPDLFFSTHPKTEEDVDRVIDEERAGFNKAVRNSLKRHLKTYMIWKDKTFAELKTRRVFTLKFLRQHYDIIRMYMTWVKPYLRHIRRMSLDEEKVMTPDMVAAFEGSMVEVEFLASRFPVELKLKQTNKTIKSCILAHFLFRTRPSMSYQQEGYQRGPIHVGTMYMNLRSYAWSQEQIDSYLKMKEHEDLELLKSVSESVKSAMDSLGGELERYLQEAGEEFEKEAEGKEGKPTFAERFKAEFIGPTAKSRPKAAAKKAPSKLVLETEAANAKSVVKGDIFLVFKNFKKSHRMIMW